MVSVKRHEGHGWFEKISRQLPAHGTDASDTGSPSISSVSIIIPTYNEVDNIEPVVTRSLVAVEGYETEIIIIDDNSPDRTWARAQTAFADEPRVQVIRRMGTRGLGTAVCHGIEQSTNQVCAILDADLQHPPERLPELLRRFEPGVDLVVGSRHIDGGGVQSWSMIRRIVSAGATFFSKLAVPEARQLSDPMSGFFAVRRAAINGVDLTPSGFKILLEILTKADLRAVREAPYTFTNREHGESKLSLREYLRFARHLSQLAMTSRVSTHDSHPL